MEAGLTSNVNTMIIYDADYFGLASFISFARLLPDRLVYCYLTYRQYTEDATRRLQAIEEFTELGSI